MKNPLKPIDNESGFILVISLLMLLILLIIGIAAQNMSVLDLKIAGNESIHKQTFYQADSGSELSSRLTEENVSCPEGFTGTIDFVGVKDAIELAGITIVNLDFALPEDELLSDRLNASYSVANLFDLTPADTEFDDDGYDAFITNASVVLPNVTLIAGGITRATEGSGLAMNSGYSGLGYAAASGGSHIMYDEYSLKRDVANSEAIIAMRWRHSIGMEGECKY